MRSELLLVEPGHVAFTVGKLLDDTGAFMVSVVEGDSIRASSLRAVSRVLVLGRPRLVHRHDVAGAAAWLSGQIGVPAERLEASVAELRTAVGSSA